MRDVRYKIDIINIVLPLNIWCICIYLYITEVLLKLTWLKTLEGFSICQVWANKVIWEKVEKSKINNTPENYNLGKIVRLSFPLNFLFQISF